MKHARNKQYSGLCDGMHQVLFVVYDLATPKRQKRVSCCEKMIGVEYCTEG